MYGAYFCYSGVPLGTSLVSVSMCVVFITRRFKERYHPLLVLATIDVKYIGSSIPLQEDQGHTTVAGSVQHVLDREVGSRPLQPSRPAAVTHQ